MLFSKQNIRRALTGLITIALVIFYVLILLGCFSTSPGLPGLFLVKLANNQSHAEVHIGLFSLCAGIGANGSTAAAAANLSCGGTLGQSMASNASSAKFLLPGSSAIAPAALQPLLALAADIQSSSTGPGGVLALVYVPLLLSVLCFSGAGAALAAYSAMQRQAVKKRADAYADDAAAAAHDKMRRAGQAASFLTTGAAMAAVAAALASTVAVRALLYAGAVLPGSTTTAATAAAGHTTGTVVSGGVPLQVLEWLVAVLMLVWHPVVAGVWQKALR